MELIASGLTAHRYGAAVGPDLARCRRVGRAGQGRQRKAAAAGLLAPIGTLPASNVRIVVMVKAAPAAPVI
jgi:hypothetical protein